MLCVRKVRYSISVNNSYDIGPICPERSLRHGDSLSPYLFILCTEGLFALFSNTQAAGELNGCYIAQSSPSVTNLLFADDSFFFCRANVLECEVKHMLIVYV